MEFNVKSGNPEKQRTACLIIGVSQPRKLSRAGKLIDKMSDGFLSTIIRRGDMDGRLGQTRVLHNVAGTLADRVLLVGCGKEKDLNEQSYLKVLDSLSKALENIGAMEAYSYLTDINIKGRDIHWKIIQTVMRMEKNRYNFDQLKSKKNEAPRGIRKLVMNVPSRRDLNKGEQAIQQGIAISSGVSLAKDLGNLPGNICTPTYLAEQAIRLGKTFPSISVVILEESDMKKLEMGSLLSVAAGSRQPPKLISMEYHGGPADQKPIVLVGKGVTFDSGGISIKPGAAMDEMKYDMCGAAAVLGTLSAVAEMQLPINVVGIIPATENLPDGMATKPGDIVTSMSGLSIEILNTDAEGRLILCDALTYAEKFDPDVVIDIATLTGACIIALGRHPSAVLGNHSPLVNDLIGSGKKIEDKLWELPLWEEYQEQLKSNFADLANIGGRDGGAITAACFLANFTKKYKWAHLDIAGTAWISGENKGSTGRPVPLLTQYILDRINP
ncbi:MAG: leucyl aminopeptidase [Gammaproteobacteria bacterium]|nr:leucyl aminopeptidase [Gammaproteobacteria bacterium]MBL7000048.1 leucyl aminopeptidase [Gammaproteobacteria bacterium]